MADWRRRVPHTIAVTRIAVGLGLVVAPGVVGRIFLGSDASRPRVRFLSRMFGGRDVAVGVLLARALRAEDPVALHRALLLGAGCDAWDAASAWRGGDLPWWGRVSVGVTAATAAVAGTVAALAPAADDGPVPA